MTVNFAAVIESVSNAKIDSALMIAGSALVVEDFVPTTMTLTRRTKTTNSAATSAPPASAQTDPASPTHPAKTKPSASPSPAPTPHLHNAAAVPSPHQSAAQSLQNCPLRCPVRARHHVPVSKISDSPQIKVRPYPLKCPPFFVAPTNRCALRQDASVPLSALCVSALSFLALSPAPHCNR